MTYKCTDLISTEQLGRRIKNKAKELGFHSCGFSKAEPLKEDVLFLEQWLADGKHGQMRFLEKNPEKRTNPEKLLQGAKTVISLICYYNTEEKQNPECSYKISRYAYGQDYHSIISKKLQELTSFIGKEMQMEPPPYYVDSGQILEKKWASKCGLGWIGKNTLLINPEIGSFIFLAEIVLRHELPYDEGMEDQCGNCSKCMEACPTGALNPQNPYTLDARKCISYLTIELKENMPEQYRQKCKGWIFGCDICQEACPHNRHAKAHNVPEIKPLTPIASWHQTDWQSLTNDKFTRYFKKGKSPIGRVKYEKIMDNIRASAASSQ